MTLTDQLTMIPLNAIFLFCCWFLASGVVCSLWPLLFDQGAGGDSDLEKGVAMGAASGSCAVFLSRSYLPFPLTNCGPLVTYGSVAVLLVLVAAVMWKRDR